MVDASPALVWQLVKGHNAFLRKNLNNTWFSTEQGNIAGKASFKYSGLANDKTVSIRPSFAEDNAGVVVAVKGKNGKMTSFTSKKDAKRCARNVGKTVGNYRPDLVQPAMAAASCAAAGVRRSKITA